MTLLQTHQISLNFFCPPDSRQKKYARKHSKSKTRQALHFEFLAHEMLHTAYLVATTSFAALHLFFFGGAGFYYIMPSQESILNSIWHLQNPEGRFPLSFFSRRWMILHAFKYGGSSYFKRLIKDHIIPQSLALFPQKNLSIVITWWLSWSGSLPKLPTPLFHGLLVT